MLLLMIVIVVIVIVIACKLAGVGGKAASIPIPTLQVRFKTPTCRPKYATSSVESTPKARTEQARSATPDVRPAASTPQRQCSVIGGIGQLAQTCNGHVYAL